MGEYEPHDSRNVTLKQQRAPGEPPRTGPREGETRQQEQQTELEQDERDDATRRERSIELDTEELDETGRESPDG
jgi:hypothetical protein